MQYNRDIILELKQWKDKKEKKPLIILGARQIGKTTVIKDFGEEHFSNYAYFNFERRLDAHQIFEETKDPIRIIENLSLLSGQDIKANESLLILDEIQVCREAITALKYFEEEYKALHIIAAGSLLGLTLGNNSSFPVGKVEFLEMNPLSFTEYLNGIDSKNAKAYHHFINAPIGKIPDAFFNPIMEHFNNYLISGGMPEVAKTIAETKSIEKAQVIQDQILTSYQLDFAKYASNTMSARIKYIWDSLPSQLAKENKKFLYRVIKKGARAREYEEALTWLEQARLVHKVHQISKPSLPLSAYKDIGAFKIYTLDVGLLIRMAELNPKSLLVGSDLFLEFKGSLAENYVAQSLHMHLKNSIYYWTSSGIAELDFIISDGENVFPIEVKSGNSTKAKSLKVYDEKYNPKLKIRISNKNLDLKDRLLNLPIFYTDYISHFAEKCMTIVVK